MMYDIVLVQTGTSIDGQTARVPPRDPRIICPRSQWRISCSIRALRFITVKQPVPPGQPRVIRTYQEGIYVAQVNFNHRFCESCGVLNPKLGKELKQLLCPSVSPQSDLLDQKRQLETGLGKRFCARSVLKVTRCDWSRLLDYTRFAHQNTKTDHKLVFLLKCFYFSYHLIHTFRPWHNIVVLTLTVSHILSNTYL